MTAGPRLALHSRKHSFGRGLGSKLLWLLLAFGVVPLGTVTVVGYLVSRTVVLDQSRQALRSLVDAQAIHVGTELQRERLLLRTISGQLPDGDHLFGTPPEELAQLLIRSLPDDGVFDGLRLVTDDGRVLANVALRQTAPHWPAATPAAEWSRAQTKVHRDTTAVLAYLVAVHAPGTRPTTWLEGHVREADILRIFSMPEHLLPGVESAVLERDGLPVFVAHQHASEQLRELVRGLNLDSSAVLRLSSAEPFLIAHAPVRESDWAFVAVLPLAIALAPLETLRNTAIVGAAVLILLILVTAAAASRSVTTPLRQLAEAVRRFGREGQQHPITVHAADEVGAVVESFNTMAANLERSRLELETLHARDLERAQQLATVGELASGVAHEIRNPLTGVRGALELALQKLPSGEESRMLLEEAHRQLARIESATTQLLRYARPPELHTVSADVNLVVGRARTIVEPQASLAGIALRVESTPQPVTVKVDPDLMIQVLVNLLLNGIDVTPAGGTVTVWVTAHAPDVWIGVRDTGSGIRPEHAKDIFRPFFTTKSKGTGLGLPLSRQIVERHGGTLRVEDTPGGGATFVVALPLDDE